MRDEGLFAGTQGLHATIFAEWRLCQSFRAALVWIGRGGASWIARKTKKGTRYWRGNSQCAKPSETRQRRSKVCRIGFG